MSFGESLWKKFPDAYGDEVPDVVEVADMSLIADEKPLDVVEVRGMARSGETVEAVFLRFPFALVLVFRCFVVDVVCS